MHDKWLDCVGRNAKHSFKFETETCVVQRFWQWKKKWKRKRQPSVNRLFLLWSDGKRAARRRALLPCFFFLYNCLIRRKESFVFRIRGRAGEGKTIQLKSKHFAHTHTHTQSYTNKTLCFIVVFVVVFVPKMKQQRFPCFVGGIFRVWGKGSRCLPTEIFTDRLIS